MKISYSKNYLKHTHRIIGVIILLFYISISCFAESTYAQTTKLSLNLSQARISEVFQFVEKNSEYVFFYSGQVRSELI